MMDFCMIFLPRLLPAELVMHELVDQLNRARSYSDLDYYKLRVVLTQGIEMEEVGNLFFPDLPPILQDYSRLDLGEVDELLSLMEPLVERCKELMAIYGPKSRKVKTEMAEITVQVRREVWQFGKRFYESSKRRLQRWAYALKIWMNEADANPVLLFRRSKARAEAENLERIGRDESWRKLNAELDAAVEEVSRRVEAQKLYTGFATATNSDLNGKMWTSILEELREKVTAVWRIATTEADELSRHVDAEVSEAYREAVAWGASCHLWGVAQLEAEELWRRAGAEELWRRAGAEELWRRAGAEEVWRRADAASMMKAAEEECMQSLEDMFTKLMAIEGEEEDLGMKQKEEARLVYAVAVSAVAFLALVYLYLVGLIDRGGTKTYSPSSRDFRSSFVSILLFLGSYVWIEFRDPATRNLASRRGYCRPGQTKIEARYRPPRASGNDNYIHLGLCDTHEEAWIKRQIAMFCYDRRSSRLEFEDGHHFCIPPTLLEPANLSVAEKRKWVVTRVMEVYEDFKRSREGIAPIEQNSALEHHLPRPPVGQFEHDTSVVLDLEFRVEGVPLLEDGGADFVEFLESFSDSLVAMSDFPDAEPQYVQDNHVPEVVITGVNNLGDGSQPGLQASWDSAHMNAVLGRASEVAVGELANGGAAQNIISQSSFEVPSTSSPSWESPTNFELFQQHLAPMAGLSNMVNPSVVHLCQPQNSTLELQTAYKLIRFLEQQIEEKDRRIAEQDSLKEEQARRIVELNREVEHLRSISQQ